MAIRIAIAAVCAAMLLVGGIFWIAWSSAVHSGLTDPHAVPGPESDPEAAVQLDLTHLGLVFQGIVVDSLGTTARYVAPSHGFVTISAVQSSSGLDALARYDRWLELTMFDSINGTSLKQVSQNVASLGSTEAYYYAWQRDRWIIVIRVPAAADQPDSLRTAIRDALFRHFGAQ